MTDASAAKGIASRRGIGKVRHIEVHQLWIQYTVAKGEIKNVKVRGEDNMSDILTKHVDRQRLERHLEAMHCMRDSSRHLEAPSLVNG